MNETTQLLTQDSPSGEKQEERLTRAAIYIRVNHSQSDQAVDAAEQERACRKAAEERGYNVVALYRDDEPYRVKNNRLVSPSGRDVDRPGLNALLQAAAVGEFGTVIATREDRFYRGLKAMLFVLDAILKHRINIQLVKETFDPNLVPIKLWMAGMEREARIERARIGAKARQSSSQKNNGKE